MNRRAHVRSGADNLGSVDAPLRGRRVGLMTNPTGVNRNLASTIDILGGEYNLTALFSCEHGVRGDAQAGEEIKTYTDPDTGVPVYSAYGDSTRLSPELLGTFDTLVFDIQDVGVRFYTYLYSLGYAMEECAKAGKDVVVLDRINPIGGLRRAGTVLNPKFRSFVGDYELPARTGLTVGEFALYLKDYLKLDMGLHIAPLQGWSREMYLDETDLPWIAPSPNCQAFSTALVYPGSCVFEGSNISEGRGTTQPFELIGAPFINGAELERRMAALKLPGLHFRRASFRPVFSKHAHKLCHGVQIHVLDRDEADVVYAGLRLMDEIRALNPEEFEFISWDGGESYAIDRLLGTDEYRAGGLSADALLSAHAPRLAEFSGRVAPHLLYR